MALKRNERYPGRFDNPTAAHPQGAFKNRTTPTAKDGSYLERDWANDWDGFMSSLLDAAAITPNGDVDEVGASQYYSALLQVIASSIPAPLPQPAINGSFRNLKASATGTSHPVTITADEVVVKNGSGLAQLLSAVNLSVSAAVSGANGLDTGTSAANTWYSIFVIWNGTTTSGLLSLSATSPTLPSGYTHFARVGWIRTDGTANKYPLSFIQYGRKVKYKVVTASNVTGYPIAAAGVAGAPNTPTYIQVSISAFVPTSASSVVYEYTHNQGDFNINAIVSTTNQTGPLHSVTNPPEWGFTNTNVGGTASYPVCSLLETQNLYWANNNGNGKLRILGWEDSL